MCLYKEFTELIIEDKDRLIMSHSCCNELRIRGATKDRERFVVNWIMYIETIHMYLYSEFTELIIEDKNRTNYESELCRWFHMSTCAVPRVHVSTCAVPRLCRDHTSACAVPHRLCLRHLLCHHHLVRSVIPLHIPSHMKIHM